MRVNLTYEEFKEIKKRQSVEDFKTLLAAIDEDPSPVEKAAVRAKATKKKAAAKRKVAAEEKDAAAKEKETKSSYFPPATPYDSPSTTGTNWS